MLQKRPSPSLRNPPQTADASRGGTTKVKEIMMGTPYTCHKEANVGEAAELMRKGNCGFLFLPITGGRTKECAESSLTGISAWRSLRTTSR